MLIFMYTDMFVFSISTRARPVGGGISLPGLVEVQVNWPRHPVIKKKKKRKCYIQLHVYCTVVWARVKQVQ